MQIWKIGKGIDQLKEWFRKEDNNKNKIIHNVLILLSYLRLMIFQIIALHIGTCLFLYSSVHIQETYEGLFNEQKKALKTNWWSPLNDHGHKHDFETIILEIFDQKNQET